MTLSLEQAFARASSLPDLVQEQLAEQMLEDIENELKWDQALANSQDCLERLAERARRAHQQGKTTPKGFDRLLKQM